MQVMKQGTIMLLAALVALTLIGCADPTEGKPKAEVGDAAPEAGATPAGKLYSLGDESKIEFVGSKVTGSHKGGFRTFAGDITVVDNDPTKSAVRVLIDTSSLWADNERLTGHLKSADFFDVETHPRANFESTEIRRNGEAFEITGNLELHGVKKSITFPAQITVEPGSITAKAEFSIKRFDFGIAYAGKADDLIRDDVLIRLDLKAAPEAV